MVCQENTTPHQLAEYAIKMSMGKGGSRYILGICGVPGAGKSTFAEEFVRCYNTRGGSACVVPMDGFHLTNKMLDERSLRHCKGSPNTYDVMSLLILLARLSSHTSETLLAPKYDRHIHDPVQHAIAIEPKHKLIVVEGNYLLYDQEPWCRVKLLLDTVWYLDADRETTTVRIQQRRQKGGLSAEEARAKVESIDWPNDELVRATQHRADLFITLQNSLKW